MQKIGDIPNTRADINGEFTDGNVAGGVPPTILPAEWFNTIQRELISVLSAAGITPDSDKFDQVATAVSKLITAGGFLKTANNLSEIKTAGTVALAATRENLGLGTAATKNVGTGAGQIPDMNSFTSGAGWVKYPDGTIIQRGRANSSDAGYALVNFPVPFAVGFTLALLPVSTANPPATRYSANMGPLGDGKTNFSFAVWVLNSSTISSVGTDWIAIGK